MKLIVGLGNPGSKYKYTKHNIGFLVLDHFLKDKKEKYKEKFNGLYYMDIINKEKVIFLKPQSYMNLSGFVVKKYVDFYKIENKDILVIYDDISFDFGDFKLKPKGNAGGHNGIKNIIDCLATNEFPRLKIGISRNDKVLKDYVLSKLSKKEKEILEEVFNKTDSIILDFIKEDFQTVMNKYN